MPTKKLLFDGDMILYRACFASEKEIKWDDDIFTLHADFSDLKDCFISLIDEISTNIGCFDVELAFSQKKTFRHELNEEYKAHRKDKRSPLGINSLREWASEVWPTHCWPRLEADDVLGILGSDTANNYTLVSGDKDFKTVPCEWYNFLSEETFVIEEKEADYNHLVQTLSGDLTDGYKGVPGVGEKTAKKLLDKNGATWQTIKDAYEKAGMDEGDALMNARMARILRAGDYNQQTNKVKLWKPKQ